MSNKHTPGPWFNRTIGKPHPERVANARLIASAPELLEALKLALTLISPADEIASELTMITQAITKAEGRE